MSRERLLAAAHPRGPDDVRIYWRELTGYIELG
jgi:hypothetical protein